MHRLAPLRLKCTQKHATLVNECPKPASRAAFIGSFHCVPWYFTQSVMTRRQPSVTCFNSDCSVSSQSDCVRRGRPWRYTVISSTPDFQTEYQICRNSNPAGLPVFTAIWGHDFRESIIILTHMLKQVKLFRITLMTMFKVTTSPPNELR